MQFLQPQVVRFVPVAVVCVVCVNFVVSLVGVVCVISLAFTVNVYVVSVLI